MTSPRDRHTYPPEDVPGDTQAPDIVSPTGEEMPAKTHDEVSDPPASPPRPPHQQRRDHGSAHHRSSDAAATSTQGRMP